MYFVNLPKENRTLELIAWDASYDNVFCGKGLDYNALKWDSGFDD